MDIYKITQKNSPIRSFANRVQKDIVTKNKNLHIVLVNPSKIYKTMDFDEF